MMMLPIMTAAGCHQIERNANKMNGLLTESGASKKKMETNAAPSQGNREMGANIEMVAERYIRPLLCTNELFTYLPPVR